MNFPWILRQPDARRAPFARALLPEVFTHPGVEPRLWLVEREQPARLLAAGAWALATDENGPFARLHLRVIGPARRRRIGTALLEHLATEAAAAGARRLESWTEIASNDTPTTAFLTAMGFAPRAATERWRHGLAGDGALATSLAMAPDHAITQRWIAVVERACRGPNG